MDPARNRESARPVRTAARPSRAPEIPEVEALSPLQQHPNPGDVVTQAPMPQAFPVGHIHPVGVGQLLEGGSYEEDRIGPRSMRPGGARC